MRRNILIDLGIIIVIAVVVIIVISVNNLAPGASYG